MRSALVVSLLAVVTASGCNKDTQPTPEQPSSAGLQQPTPAAPAAPAPQPAATAAGAEPAAPVAAGSSISEENFELALKPSGSYKVGQAGAVEVVLDAKEPFKVNDKYPYKFKLEPSDGLKFANQVVKEEGLKLEKKRAVMTVGFTPETAGQKNVKGQFSFSVCTEERCLIEKRELSLAIDVQ